MLTNEEYFDLEQANKKLALTIMKVKDEETRSRLLKAVYTVGKVLNEENSPGPER